MAFRRFCGADFSSISIDADGTACTCHMVHIRKYCMGNVLDGRLEDALLGNVGTDFLVAFRAFGGKVCGLFM